MKIYHFNLNYQTVKRGITVDTTRSAVLNAGGNYFNLRDIAEFLDDVKKIYADVKRLAKECKYIDVEICVSEYENDSNYIVKNFDRWTYNGIAEAEGIHLDADTKYTNECHDMWLDFAKFDPLHDITA